MAELTSGVPMYIEYDDKWRPKVNPALLAECLLSDNHFLFAQDNGRSCKQTYLYAHGVYECCDKDRIKGMLQESIRAYRPSLVKSRDVKDAYDLLCSNLSDRIAINDLDGDEDIINFANGLLQVTADKIELMPHNPDILSTIQIPCDWVDCSVETPVFDDYLDTLTNGDKEVANLLMQYIGVAISNVRGHRMKKMLFLVGPGNTGKSQLKALCEKIIGANNCSSCDLNDLEERFGTSSLYRKRLAGSADISFRALKEVSTLKKLTGGDSIRAEYKGLPAFDYTYNGLLWFCTNSLPAFCGDRGKWVYDRIIAIECKNVIPMDKQDKCLLDKLYAERTGIIQKAVKALQKVIANGYRFDEPQCVIDSREQYKRSNDSVTVFFTDCMEKCTDGTIDPAWTTGKTFRAYVLWCRDNHYAQENESSFREQMSLLMGGACFTDVITKRVGLSFYRDYKLTYDVRNTYLCALRG